MRETHNKKTLRLSRVIAGAVTALLTAAAAAVGTVIYGIMDYLYDPEFFRPGKKPRPSPDTAPGEAEVDPPLLRVGEGRQTVTLRFRCGPGGISEDGGIKVGFCRLVDFGAKGKRPTYLYADGWGPKQNRYPRLPNFYSCELRSSGGARLEVNGVLDVEHTPHEYEDIYDRFAELLRDRRSLVDAAPLRLVADAFMVGRRLVTEPFHD